MSHLEIEKRYLCKNSIIGTLKSNSISYIILSLEQFYLVANKKETLRYRKDGNKYIKNIKKGSGLVREESEIEVSKKEYKRAKRKNSGGIIKKSRYKFIIDGMLYELDIFKGKLKGLSILEIEFEDIYQANEYKVPPILEPFISKEITLEPIYSNGALSKSMQIPLRDDSYLSLESILKSNKKSKPSLDLYIADYENSKFALQNSITRLYSSFKYNIKYFHKVNEMKYLIKANRSLERIYTLIKLHKKYISRDSYRETLFKFASLMLLLEEVVQTEKCFLKLLKKRNKLPQNKQISALKELISLAKKEKILRDPIVDSNLGKNIKKVEKYINGIEYKKLDKPFCYITTKLINRATKKVNSSIKSGSKTETLKRLKLLKVAYEFGRVKSTIGKKRYKKLKNTILIESCYSIVNNPKVLNRYKVKNIKLDRLIK